MTFKISHTEHLELIFIQQASREKEEEITEDS